MTVGRVTKSVYSPRWVVLCQPGGPLVGTDRSLGENAPAVCPSGWLRSPLRYPPGHGRDRARPGRSLGGRVWVMHPCRPPTQVSQIAVDIPTAYCHDHHGIVPNSPLCLPPTCPRRRWFRKVADPTSESEGRPEEAPTDSSPWALPRDVYSLQYWAHSPLKPPTATTEAGARRRARAEQGTQTWDSRRARQLGGSRGPLPHERGSRRVLAVSRMLQRPRSCGSDRPRRSQYWGAGSRQKQEGLGGQGGSLEAAVGDFWLAISEAILWGDWQPSAAR